MPKKDTKKYASILREISSNLFTQEDWNPFINERTGNIKKEKFSKLIGCSVRALSPRGENETELTVELEKLQNNLRERGILPNKKDIAETTANDAYIEANKIGANRAANRRIESLQNQLASMEKELQKKDSEIQKKNELLKKYKVMDSVIKSTGQIPLPFIGK